ncbi:MAG: glycoside hydrolase family 2 [Erysipelotrichaceae bacterium]|nr:glycoside hydrolase family 2 [Erysipelotrichaceae bacterium]
MNAYVNTYPRPQFRRASFFSLDGKWRLNGKEIEVPFPKESALSGYPDKEHEDLLEYHKRFRLPDGFLKKSQKLILHFTAVDQICDVFFNDHYLGNHKGGYLPFEYDVSEYLRKDNYICVKARDDLDTFYPYGKQSKKPHGMWYTPVSGIWGSVWLEAVPVRERIKGIKVDTKADRIRIRVDTDAKAYTFRIIFDEDMYEKTFKKKEFEIDLKALNIKYRKWSPDDPVLYDFSVITRYDKVDSYLAVREVKTRRVGEYKRLFLNDEPLFVNGVLDQGYFDDGLYLPGDPKEYLSDIRRMKELGINLLRKHIKIEPDIFYYYCDREGILVMQDMVNSGDFRPVMDTVFPTVGLVNKDDGQRVDEERYAFFIEHSKETIRYLYNHPSIIAWTIYNEGWGQQKSSEAYHTLKKLDPNRLFDTASGWFKPNDSDIDSYHVYFRNKVLSAKDKEKLLFLSEFGGVVRKIEDHIFTEREANYGYGVKNSEAELNKAILGQYSRMVIPSIENGLCGCIYTQLSDVEEEVNGLYTYDREVCKVSKEIMREIRKMVDNAYREALRNDQLK